MQKEELNLLISYKKYRMLPKAEQYNIIFHMSS